MKKNDIKEIFLYYGESYSDTNMFLKTHEHDQKSIKKFFAMNFFKISKSNEVTKSNQEEEKIEEKYSTPKKNVSLKEPEEYESPNEILSNQNKNEFFLDPLSEIKPMKECVLMHLSESFLSLLFDYFDPLSLANMGMACKYFHEISKRNLLYKKFCVILFSNKNNIPPLNISPFSLLKEYIAKNPLEFDQTTRNQANFDIRSLVWGTHNYIDEYKTANSFYKQFTNWKNCFLLAPRVCFKGYYILKEKYIKVGEKDISQSYDPVFVVEFYRYMRFFYNGLVIMIISSLKLPQEKIIKLFKKALKSEDDNSMVENPLNLFLQPNKPKNELKQTIIKGEYFRKEGKILAKFCSKGSSLYEYELAIKSSQTGKNDMLFVLSRTNRELTTNYVRDDNDQRASGMKVFEFKKIKEFGNDIEDLRFRCVTL